MIVCIGLTAASIGFADGSRQAQLDFRAIVQDAKDKVFPGVVFIKCIREGYEGGKRTSSETAGSGVIINGSGEVLTNWHVVDHATEIRCLLYDGQAMDAKVLGSDKDTDVALLQLQIPEGGSVPATSTLGDSTVLREGDFVMAMGAPWGMSRSVSIGIISCTRRYIPGHSEYSLWLQTDASISPGNSGGPLVNTAGETVGLNARGVLVGGDVGFAVPSDTIALLVPQLREHGSAQWSHTGVELQPLRDFNRNIYFDATEGVIVADTAPDSPARRAGLQPRDRIHHVNGEPVTAVTEEELPALRRRFGLLPPGKPAKFEIARGQKMLEVDITPTTKGKVEGEELECKRWNLTAKSINQFENPNLYFHRKEGVFVFGTEYPGNAASCGLARNDIIMKIGDRAVSTLEDVRKAYEASMGHVDNNPRLMFTVLRNGLIRQVVLDYSTDHDKE